jgi:hypothetical protein
MERDICAIWGPMCPFACHWVHDDDKPDDDKPGEIVRQVDWRSKPSTLCKLPGRCQSDGICLRINDEWCV